MGLEVAICLPMTFDAERLQHDRKAIGRHKMLAHYGNYHDGKWSAIGLVTQEGQPENLQMGPHPYQKTELLNVCPYFNCSCPVWRDC